jgi:hypothetical protein
MSSNEGFRQEGSRLLIQILNTSCHRGTKEEEKDIYQKAIETPLNKFNNERKNNNQMTEQT